MGEKVKVLLVEDHEMTRMGLQLGIEKSKDLEFTGEAVDGLEAVRKAKELLPDVILMDIGLPEIDGIEATKRIKDMELNTKILMFTSREESEDVFAALGAGADGYVTKGTNFEQLTAAISAVNSGASWLDPVIARMVLNRATQPISTVNKNPAEFIKKVGLTKRELEVLALIADGYENEEISDKLIISFSTAKTHVHNILQKLSARNKMQARNIAAQEGII